MQDNKDLINQVAGQLKQQASTRVSSTSSGGTQHSDRTPPSDCKIDAINQIFTLFRVNYHNQYYKAFSDTETLVTAKRLWMESLGHFDTEALLRGAKHAIESSEYLPTLKKMIEVLNKHPNLWVLLDDIYEKLNFKSQRNINLFNLDAKHKRRSLLVNGF